ncbi:hypothetical protein QFC19_002860 [Naganishia cerealis]|uniref:Uncharacterized protein n=1 Tax=Naganishia cerealis TaxID=610337 RepID=A0ACC2W636_9TREE|nr:hypothetical protein QFC19_002860 [Naganishia cerealis]
MKKAKSIANHVAQQATSFETLRQIVSATSPNSRPRRHREFHHALAGQTSGFERGRSTSLDEFDSDSKTVRLDQRGKARDDGYQTREHEQGIMPTTSATLRYAMQPSPPSPSRSLEPVVGNHSSSTQIGMGGYVRPERKISPHRQQSRRRLPPAVAPFQERKGQHQTQDLTSTGSLSDEDNGEQEDVLDTAPPSDLDERFPALSPQPSPLNSRRHGQVGRSPHIEGVSSVTDREERFQMRMRADTPKTDGQWQYGEAGPPFYPDELRQDDSRWNETKGMVDAFLSSKEHQRRGSATNAHQRSIGNLETRMVSSDTTRQHLSGRQESGIAKTPLSASTVLDRIDSVTNEVHALRSQIAELVTLIPRLLVAGVEPGRGISDVVADVAELGRDHRIQSQEQETIHLPNPIKIQSLLLHLDFLVHHRAVPLTDGAVTGDAPARSERDILHVCESRNLDLIREKVTDWEGVMRGREPVGLVRKGSQ